MTSKVIFLFPFLFAVLQGIGQDTIELRSFTMIDSNIVRLTSSFEHRFDSLQKLSPTSDFSIPDILTKEGAISFKNYGPGLLSTPTFRGGDANHTQVVWNGMQLNSPMLGSIDFSTLPTAQFTALSIMSGVSSTLYASGGMGSIVAIEQHVDYKTESARIVIGGGSFGTIQSVLHFNLPMTIMNRPSVLSFSTDVQFIKNNFPYTNTAIEPWHRNVMKGAEFNRRNISLTMSSKVTDKVEVEAIYWSNLTTRLVPSTINVSHRVSSQQDDAERLLFRVTRQTEKWRTSFRAMLENNDNLYEDPSLNISTLNSFQTFRNHLESSYQSTTWLTLVCRLGVDLIQAESDFYNEPKEAVNKNVVFVTKLDLGKHRLSFDAGVRGEEYNRMSRLLPFAGARMKLHKRLPIDIVTSASKTVRFPTLNELYWRPGGNLELNPEDGYTIEGGFEVSKEQGSLKAVVYHNQYNNRIRWLPDGQVFSPVNIDEAFAQGIDLTARVQQRFNLILLQATNAYHFADAKGRNSGKEYKPLTYVPEHSVSSKLSVGYKNSEWYISHYYLDRRPITNSSYMPHYHTFSFGGLYKHAFSKGFQIGLSAWIDNLMDWEYQNMPWRPMPGRSFYFKLDLQWGE